MAYGTTTNLVGGTVTLTKPGRAFFMYILNQDTAPLNVSFQRAGVIIGGLSLSAATATGAPGGYIDSVDFPMFFDANAAVLTSTIATAQFASGQSQFPPSYQGGGPA